MYEALELPRWSTCSSLVTFKPNTKLAHCKTSDLLCVWACNELLLLMMLLAISVAATESCSRCPFTHTTGLKRGTSALPRRTQHSAEKSPTPGFQLVAATSYKKTAEAVSTPDNPS